MSLTARDRARFARHLLLPQLGEAGQERLLAARLRAPESFTVDSGALEVACSYLTRAGVSLVDDREAPLFTVASCAEIERIAGRPELREAARALAGALAAVAVVQTFAGFAPCPAEPAIPVISSEEA